MISDGYSESQLPSSKQETVICSQILTEFDKFYRDFRAITYSAKTAFENRDYGGVLTASRERLSMYSVSMNSI